MRLDRMHACKETKRRKKHIKRCDRYLIRITRVINILKRRIRQFKRIRFSQSSDTLDCAVNTHLSLPFLKNPPLERFKRLIITHTVVHPLLHLTYTSAYPRGLSQLALRSALSSLPCPVISAANARNTLAVKKASYPASCCCSCTPY